MITKITDFKDLNNIPILDFIPDSFSFREISIPLHSIIGLTKTAQFLQIFYEKDFKKFSASYTFINRKEIYDFLTFIHNINGSLKKFWLPIFLNQFKLTRDVNANENFIYIKNSGLTTLLPENHKTAIRLFFFQPLSNNKFLMLTRRIFRTELVSDDEEKIILTHNLNHRFLANDILLISKLALVRLSTDKIEINYSFSNIQDKHNLVVAKVNLEFIELPFEHLNLDRS